MLSLTKGNVSVVQYKMVMGPSVQGSIKRQEYTGSLQLRQVDNGVPT